MSTTLEQAVVGRRVLFAYYRAPDTYLPGIITAIRDDAATLQVRLDGRRTTIPCPADYRGLRYLNEVVPVPELTMGRFRPTAKDFGGAWEGVPVCRMEEDDIVILAAVPSAARGAAAAYLREVCGDSDDVIREYLRWLTDRWVTFEWQREDAEYPWLMVSAAEGDEQALHIHYLPA
ncbi:hypothetical protein OG760_37680 (plasmid) [Streptomyces sp. NBC_00963]|uniref:hypothetical protein n=1 Tax=Streptomyces sp. NBC_00963 TaxID=2903697 RepID=UPI002F907697|nr:hypothetical protein OG760_37680 [Streptomyces sp. NBC_00963]